MTDDTLHDLPPTFQWSPTYLTQLQHIADTDEFLHEDEAHSHTRQLSASSSAAGGASGSSPGAAPLHPGVYDWPLLKDAIKYRIRYCLEETFGQEWQMELHPATKLMPYVGEGGDLEEVWHKADSGALCEKKEKVDEVQGSEGVDANGAAAVESAADAVQNGVEETQVNGTSSSTPSGRAADDEPSTSAITNYTYRSDSTPDPALTHPPFVHRADILHFYPTTRPLPHPACFPPLTAASILTHTRNLYSLLDDFDTQPPFTIQRLCELIVSPLHHYRSPLKWISAIQRCLSVTATRDAFPISPVQAPVGVVANGTHDGSAVISELEMDRMDGLPAAGVRSRSSSVGSNASVSEPLFSPIPFIVRDETGQLTSSGAAQQLGEDAVESAAVAAGLMEPIPDLELGGADRTQMGDSLPKEVVDVAPSANVPVEASTDSKDEVQATEGGQDELMVESADEPMQEETSDPASLSTASTAIAADAVAAAVEASPAATTTSAPTSAGPTEALGIPDGQVDEIDNPTLTLKPLTSTTSTSSDTAPSTVSTAPSAAEGASQPADRSPSDPADADEEEQEDTPRSTKRRKSVASIHDQARD